MIEVGIVGGTGYTGAELLRLLGRHPQARVTQLTSRQEAGRRVDAYFPHLRGACELSFSAPDVDALARCQAVFFAAPHGTAMAMTPALLERGVRVIDLSADFRLREAAIYKRWYQHEHSCPSLLQEAVYGIPEINRERLRKARLVANPGCYPTCVQLGLLPLLEAGLVDTTSLIADCKSGVSGAGRELKLGSMLCEAGDNVKSYGVAGHRHLPEIEQELALVANAPVGITFIPHLMPMIRGMQATIYARLKQPGRIAATDLQALFEERFRSERFIDVLPSGAEPETRSVRGSNLCRLAVHRPGGGDTVVVLSVIDNLVKGASGQAVQCFNLMFGCEETAGLDVAPLVP